MTTHAGLSDDRIAAILDGHDADPAGDHVHTDHEFVSLAREARRSRAEILALRAMVSRLEAEVAFASFRATRAELERRVLRGDLTPKAARDLARTLLRECHEIAAEMGGEPK